MVAAPSYVASRRIAACWRFSPVTPRWRRGKEGRQARFALPDSGETRAFCWFEFGGEGGQDLAAGQCLRRLCCRRFLQGFTQQHLYRPARAAAAQKTQHVLQSEAEGTR